MVRRIYDGQPTCFALRVDYLCRWAVIDGKEELYIRKKTINNGMRIQNAF